MKTRRLDRDRVVSTLAALFRDKYRAECEREKTFPWLKADAKPVIVDAYFAAPLNCLFVFDGAGRFTRDRAKTLASYPADVPLGFDFRLYRELCAADRARSTPQTCRQAEIDRALDLLPPKHGLNPTLRIAAAELEERIAGEPTERKLRKALDELMEKRLSVHAGTTFQQLLEHPSGKPFVPRVGL